MKMLVLDMDGTIADLYGVEDWLSKILAEDASPYEDAKFMYDQELLIEVLRELRLKGWKLAITTWFSKGSSEEYDTKVREAKIKWLNKHNIPYDEIHMVKYGTPKTSCTAHHKGYQVLVDDNNEILGDWNLGDTIDAKQRNIVAELWRLVYLGYVV
jgi:hypothetical protein